MRCIRRATHEVERVEMKPSGMPLTLARGPLGQLVFTDAAGAAHLGVVPVRAFPLSAPDDGGLSLLGADGRELAWWPSPHAVPAALRATIEAELAEREFVPAIRRIAAVSSFSTPSTWTVETDRGPTSFVLQGEEDIRRLDAAGRLLITAAGGLTFVVPDRSALDRASRRLLERFL
jgi:hypothetical protein